MSIFSAIMDKIFRHPTAAPAAAAAAAATTSAPAQPQAAPAAPSAPAGTRAGEPVDVEAVLASMADSKGDAGNWRTSIVDLLKLLDLDSSLQARKELADELGVRVGADGSAEQNLALQKAVMQKLADNGGLVPDSLRAR
jgi:3-oxoacyl-ACP reductase-like protein